MSAPRSTHYAIVLCILRYLKGTLFHGIFYSAQSPLILCAFSDADWVGDPTDRRSTTGYCFLLGSSLISWRSKKQNFVAHSNIEAEYRALADTTSKLLWLRWLLKDLGVKRHSLFKDIHFSKAFTFQIICAFHTRQTSLICSSKSHSSCFSQEKKRSPFYNAEGGDCLVSL